MHAKSDNGSEAKKIKLQTDIVSCFGNAKKITSEQQWTRVNVARTELYLYSRTKLPKLIFDCQRFRHMEDELYKAGWIDAGGAASECPPARHLNRKNVGEYSEAEFQLFRGRLHRFIREMLTRSKGNPCAQGIHDCVTLGNRIKNLSVGIILPNVESTEGIFNWAVCLCLHRTKNADSRAIATKMNNICQYMCGVPYDQLCHSTIADYAALRVAVELNHQRDGCSMHALDKVARAAVGDLTISRKKKVVNPFPKCQDLLARATKCATHFAFSKKRLDDLWQLAKASCSYSNDIRPKTELSTTRIAARHGMIKSLIRLNGVLRLYQVKYRATVDWDLSDDDWTALAEIEAVLEVIASATTLIQTEKYPMAALDPLIKHNVLQKLRGPSLDVIDLNNAHKHSLKKLSRDSRTVENLTEIGATALKRAALEMERRFCGNKAMTIDGLDGECQIKLNDRDLMSSLMDPRIADTLEFRTTEEERNLATDLLRAAYIKYGLVALKPKQQSQSAPNVPAVAEHPAPASTPTCRERKWELDDPDSSDDEAAMSHDDWVKSTKKKLSADFQKHFARWRVTIRNIDSVEGGWAKLFPECNLPSKPDPIRHLRTVPLMKFYTAMKAEKSKRGNPMYGLLPDLALFSRACVGALGASSYCERIASGGNNIVTDKSCSLSNRNVNILTTMKMNADFVDFLKDRYAAVKAEELINEVRNQDGDIEFDPFEELGGQMDFFSHVDEIDNESS